jgi:hypothetical protein
MKRMTKTLLAKLTGYDQTTFNVWLSNKGKKKMATPQTINRYESLMLGAVLIQDGWTFEGMVKFFDDFDKNNSGSLGKIARLEQINNSLKKEILRLEEGMNECADKFEQLKGIGK